MTVGKGSARAKQLLKTRVVVATSETPIGFGQMYFMSGIVAGLAALLAVPLTLGEKK